MALPMVETPTRVVKVRMQITLSRSLRVAGSKIAARWKLSLSELIESLLIKDAESDAEGLMIAPLRGTEKPHLKYPK